MKILIAAMLASLAGAQEGPAIFSTDTRLVILHATVLDKSGHLVRTLPQSAFEVYENGKLQPLKFVKYEDIPVSLGLIVDNSGSMRDKRLKVESAALGMVKESNPADEVFIVNFNDEAYLDQDFTNKIDEMKQGLTKINSSGGTAMRDAIRMSIDHLKEKGKKDKKVLLVITDGEDNFSTMSLENLVHEAQESETIIYAIGLLSEETRGDAKKAKRALTSLVEATGGQAFFPRDVSEVEGIAHQVARDLRNQYTIGYSPLDTALDGKYRTVKVVVNGANKPVVYTRSGYYAGPGRGKTFAMKRTLLIALSLVCLHARGEEPQFTAAGELKRPGNYREWIFLSSGLGMTYGSVSAGPERFDNVFVTPEAYRVFMKTGTWPDKTMFVLEIRSSETKGSINKGGYFQEGVTAVEVHLKDSARFPTKWAFFGFGADAQTAKALPGDSKCQTCHAQNGAVDETFVQFYPTLLPVAKARGTLK